MFAKSAKLAILVGLAAVSLTACTPPMPPEVKAALLEQTYTCVSGSVTVASGEPIADAVSTLQGAMAGVCPKMSFTTSPLESATAATSNMLVDYGNPAAKECDAITTVPFALDAAVVAADLSQAGGLSLSMDTVEGIFDGTITKWDDPAITKDNGGTAVGSSAINVIPTTNKFAIAAFANWYKNQTGKNFNSKLLKPKNNLKAADLGTMAEGSVALIPFSTFNAYSVNATVTPLAATIVTKQAPLGAVPDVTGIGSAGTQLSSQQTASGIGVRLDFNAKPIAPEGSDVAPTPYEAIYPLNLSLCATGGTGKTAEKVVHAVARYLMRQDSQGSLSSLVGLPESLRAISLDAVSKGLPDPKLPASSN